MMNGKMIWGVAAALYALFLAWHENWRGPLTDAEIDTYMARLATDDSISDDQRRAVKAFMENDTGHEFFMVNLMAFPDGMVTHPDTGAAMTPRALLQEYFRPFIGKMFMRASYPAYTGPVVGGYLDAWEAEADPGWSGAGLIRYRSRRDMLEGVTDPSFSSGHVYKQLALRVTYAVPSEHGAGVLLSPRSWLALLLIALAALAHVALLTVRKGKSTHA